MTGTTKGEREVEKGCLQEEDEVRKFEVKLQGIKLVISVRRWKVTVDVGKFYIKLERKISSFFQSKSCQSNFIVDHKYSDGLKSNIDRRSLRSLKLTKAEVFRSDYGIEVIMPSCPTTPRAMT